MYEEIAAQTAAAMAEVLQAAAPAPGSIVVVGCSSSEILGTRIGKGSSPEVGIAVRDALAGLLAARGVFLAAQCCEHLNRALVVERRAAERFGLEPVWVRPVVAAGGSFATAVFDGMEDAVVVEHVRAVAGLDIGDTLIGMHLKDVAVPLRIAVRRIGEAHVTSAKTRPRLIGGERAVHPRL